MQQQQQQQQPQQPQPQPQQQRVFYVLHPPASFTMGALDTNGKQLNMHVVRQTPENSPHKEAQRPFRSTIQGKGGAAHVHIAWGIYFHKQLKKMQEENKSLYLQPSPKSPRRDLPDSTPHKESQHRCRGHPYAGSYRGQRTPSEEVEDSDSAEEKLDETIKYIRTENTPTTEVNVRYSLYCKNKQLQWDRSIQEGRVKPQSKDNRGHPSLSGYPNSFLVTTPATHPSPYNQLQTGFYVFHPKGGESIISYPGTMFEPHQQTALNTGCNYFNFGQRFVKHNIFQDFFMPPFYFAPDPQETRSLKEMEGSVSVSEPRKGTVPPFRTHLTGLRLQNFSD